MDQEGRANIVANMLGRLTKITTAQCLHLRMAAWSSVQLFCTITNLLLLINTNKQNKRRKSTRNILKGKLSVQMKSGITFWSIQKLSPIWIWIITKFRLVITSHFEVYRSYHQSEFCDDPNNIIGKKDWKFITKYW